MPRPELITGRLRCGGGAIIFAFYSPYTRQQLGSPQLTPKVFRLDYGDAVGRGRLSDLDLELGSERYFLETC